MKVLFTLTLTLLLGITATFGQNKTVLGDIGNTEGGKTARAVMHSNVTTDGTFTYLDFHSGYGFVLKNEDTKAFAEIIHKYTTVEGSEMVSLGTFKTHAAVGVTTTKNISEPGTFETTYEKGTILEIKYDGEDLWIHIPETNFLRFTAKAKDIRIFKEYVSATYDAFNHE